MKNTSKKREEAIANKILWQAPKVVRLNIVKNTLNDAGASNDGGAAMS